MTVEQKWNPNTPSVRVAGSGAYPNGQIRPNGFTTPPVRFYTDPEADGDTRLAKTRSHWYWWYLVHSWSRGDQHLLVTPDKKPSCSAHRAYQEYRYWWSCHQLLLGITWVLQVRRIAGYLANSRSRMHLNSLAVPSLRRQLKTWPTGWHRSRCEEGASWKGRQQSD